ncbi:SMI1/KNR4 family protein [Aureivirga marina]|uniref:SMI1/KNR4 family protein n=1 Tax=Aureivirga marina TaxID=1182451 RepID=UPI0018CA4FCD|nr:SMI1/KNR4 family protein [Aureivirga marina]
MEIIDKIVSLIEKSKKDEDCIYEVNAKINPPVKEESIEKLEELIQFSLPEDLKNIYRKHNGIQIEFKHKEFGFNSSKMKIASIDENIEMYQNKEKYAFFLSKLKENQVFLIFYQRKPELYYGYLIDDNFDSSKIYTYDLEEFQFNGDTINSVLNNILDRVAYYSN